MKICIVGQGYIGLPTAALFAKNGCEVLGVDVNKEIVDKLNQGIAHIEEPGISDAIKNAVEKGHYHASLSPEEADTFIITVPTPYVKEDLSCDLSYVISACKSILPVLKKGNVQTRFGIFALKDFFTDAYTADEKKDLTVVKMMQELKKLIDSEDKTKPYTDDELSELLKQQGLNMARRTIAKYREQLGIPVARLRSELL